MLRLHTTESDSPEFLHRVRAVLDHLARGPRIGDVILLHVDGFFDREWCELAREVRGSEGGLAIPPFPPERVLSQRTFSCATGRPVLMPADPPLHVRIHGLATRRRVRDVAPDRSLIWYSSHTEPSGRGSLMAYVTEGGGGHDTWHAVLQLGGDGWRVARAEGMAREAIEQLLSP